MIAFAQYLHDLHGQYDNTELAGIFFGLSDAQIQLAAADHHLPHDMVHAVRMQTGSVCNQLGYIAADPAKELRRARQIFPPRFRRKNPVEIAFESRWPVNGVVDALLAVMFPQGHFQCGYRIDFEPESVFRRFVSQQVHGSIDVFELA